MLALPIPDSIADLFVTEPDRVEQMSFVAADLLVDVSRQRISTEGLGGLLAIADQCGVAKYRDAMLSGEPINVTEGRAVLHTALRRTAEETLIVDGVDVVGEVHRVRSQMVELAEEIRADEGITDVVSIGIGGSDLGPALAVEALWWRCSPQRRMHFVSNVDGSALYRVLSRLDPAGTVFIVASKTFTTIETMTNARTARQWIIDALGPDAVDDRFIAVTAQPEVAADFGISRILHFWDWVGGRYSLCSAIGLPVLVAIGADGFDELLAGHRAIDRHFAEAPFDRNVPVILGSLAVWNRNRLGATSRAIVPYADDLAGLPAYLQQLDMESNGKSVDIDGTRVTVPTGPVIWGAPGTDGQHAFFQLLHQGTDIVPVDFIGFARGADPYSHHHDLLIGNLLAQAAALAFGRSAPAEPHRHFGGNRPSTVILAEQLTPAVLGQIIALYEHQVFVQGVMWRINSFDQWGVELGKELATVFGDDLLAEQPRRHDPATDALIDWYRQFRS